MAPLILQLPTAEIEAWRALPHWPPAAWQSVAPLSFAQTWLARPDAGFRPGRVWLTATPDAFVVLAELEDIDIMTGGKKHNDPLWDLGDVFEVFLRHARRPDYYEFHVAPNGVTLDLHYPRLHAPRDQGVEQYMLAASHFSSWARAEPELNRWRVAMTIPVAPLVPQPLLCEESTWQFSFSRYDCGPGRPPIVSSTTPHQGAGFHRAEEWLHFRAPPFTALR